jgi:hypothetical protein
MMPKIFKLTALLFICTFPLLAQEELSPLMCNPALMKYKEMPKARNVQGANDTINLPFVDDFSQYDAYPDPTLWQDSNVYLTMDMALNPRSFGVMTFDGLDKYGQAYNLANPSAQGVADYLTSKYINLARNPSDSVYLSFLYQGTGIGNEPEPEDSLVLEFRAAGSAFWKHIWSVPGAEETDFTLVMIPILDTTFLKKGFQFRFKNYATLSGNLDHWHIDVVRLNSGRNRGDSLVDDIGITTRPLSFLNVYQTMPWSHYSQAGSSLHKANQWVDFRNNSGVIRNVDFGYRILQDGATIFNSNILFKNSSANSPDSANMLYNLATISANGNDSSLVEMRYFINTVPDNRMQNDTFRCEQKFYNYYAYDDGSAERAYSLNTVNAKMAIKYGTLVPDTIRGMLIYFPPVLEDATNNRFRIGIWANNNGEPGNPIYLSDSLFRPRYSTHNYFVRYLLDTAIFIADSFFVGIEQQFGGRLYVGYDRNIDNSSKLFYNLDNNWFGTDFEGSLMVRPMFGAVVSSDLGQVDQSRTEIKIYPNPAADFIRIELPSSAAFRYEIMDITGRILQKGEGQHPEIHLSGLSNGLHFIRIEQAGRVFTEKLLISKP